MLLLMKWIYQLSSHSLILQWDILMQKVQFQLPQCIPLAIVHYIATLILMSLMLGVILLSNLTQTTSTTRALDAFNLSTGWLEGVVRILRGDAGGQAMHLRFVWSGRHVILNPCGSV